MQCYVKSRTLRAARHRQTQTDTDRHRQTQTDTDRQRQTQTETTVVPF